MKPRLVLFFLTFAPAWCQIAKPAVLATSSLPAPRAARIPSQTMGELERTFNSRLTAIAPDANEAVDLLGDTRGLQLDDYGVVFTTEVSLVVTPGISPFRGWPRTRAIFPTAWKRGSTPPSTTIRRT